MAWDFPSSPTVGQTYSPVAGTTYTWNGYAWASVATSSTALTTKIIPITASTTYVPSPGLVSAIIQGVGGGGGGGGIGDTTAGSYGAGGGGSGGYSIRSVSAALIGASQTVTIGNAGAAGTSGGGNGGNGGVTSVGSLCVANGGTGGGGQTALTFQGGAGGAIGTAVGDFVAAGTPGNPGGVGAAGNYAPPGNGGSSFFGGGGRGPGYFSGSAVGGAATNYGSGGSGAWGTGVATARAGGAGSAGFVVITEFIAVTATAAPGFPVLLARIDVSSPVATVDFTSGIDGTYDEYEIHFWGMRLSATGNNVNMLVSQNNGASWVTAAASYGWQSTYFSAATQSGSQNTSDTRILIYSQAGFPTSANNSQAGVIKFFQPAATGIHKQFIIDIAGTTESAFPLRHVGHAAFYQSGAAFNGVRILPSTSGNIVAGTFALYGIKK